MKPTADRSVEALLQALRKGRHATKRLTVLEHLTPHVHREDVREALYHAALHDRSSRVRAAAVRILVETSYPSEVPILHQACTEALLRLPDPETLRHICQEFAALSLPDSRTIIELLAEVQDPHTLPLLCRRLRTHAQADEEFSDLIHAIVQLAPDAAPDALQEAQASLRADLLHHDLPIAKALDSVDAALGKGLPIPSETGVAADPRLPLPASSDAPREPSALRANEITSLTFTSRVRLASTSTPISLLLLGTAGQLLWDNGVPLPFFPAANWFCLGLALLCCFVPHQERVQLSGRELRITRRGEGFTLLPRRQYFLLPPGARVQSVPMTKSGNHYRASHLAILTADNRVVRFGHTFPAEQLQQIAAEMNAYLDALETPSATPSPIRQNPQPTEAEEQQLWRKS